MRRILFLAAITSLVAAARTDADACSPPQCWPGFFAPDNGATVPANLPVLRWSPMFGAFTSTTDPGQVVLARAAAPSTPLPFTATKLQDGTYHLVPSQPLTPGTAYVLTDQSTCGSGTMTGPSVMFQVAAAAPLPTSLGTLAQTSTLVGPLQISTASGSCSSQVEARQIRIELQLASDASPWRDALHFETLVDGQPWRASESINSTLPPGASWRGRGVDLLYLVCKTDDLTISKGLAAGAHEVVMRATLPGSGVVVQSSPLSVTLDCASDGKPGDGSSGGDSGGCDAGGSGSSSSGWLVLGSLAAAVGLRRRSPARLGGA
jgi:hypothetical protein